MLSSTLSTLTHALSNHLKLSYKLSDDIVILNALGNNERNASLNKIVVTLVNVERDTSSGIKFNYQGTSSNRYKKTMPAWQLNLYVLIAAVFSEKQYEEGLQLLSGTLSFLQNNNTFELSGTDITLAIEPVNLSLHELSNLWGICGSTYKPSIFCKIRTVTIDNDEIKKFSSAIESKDTETKL